MRPTVGDAAPDLEILEYETLDPVRLSETWRERPTALVFQRYFGCPFCQLHVARLLEDRDRFEEAGLGVVLVGHGERDTIKLGKAFAPFRILFDPDLAAYAAWGVPRGSMNDSIGPRTWGPLAKAHLHRGVRQRGAMGGDLLQLPGTFLVDRGGIVRYAYRGRSAPDYPTNDQVLEAARGLNLFGTSADVPESR